jgi:hypothetical protein
VHEAGVSVRSFARSETGVDEAGMFRYLIGDFDDA